MSFVTTQPEALMDAASKLQAIGSSMAAENAAAAAPTTGVLPAAADPVSALQAAQFSAYGTWYQQVSAHATAMHQTLVNTLGTSAGSYGQTEAANQTATGSASLSGALGGLTGSGKSSPGLSAITGPAAAGAADPPSDAVLGTPLEWGQNVPAAASDWWELCQGQFLPGSSSWNPPGTSESAAFGLTDAVGTGLPAGPSGFGGTPVLAGLGQASSVGGLSVPPSWAAVPTVSSTPATLAGTGWTSAAPQTASVTAMPAGMPSVASAGRGGLGVGAPRYGEKPTVMPKPTVV